LILRFDKGGGRNDFGFFYDDNRQPDLRPFPVDAKSWPR